MKGNGNEEVKGTMGTRGSMRKLGTIEAFEKLQRLADEADALCGKHENEPGLALFFDGQRRAYTDAIRILKDAMDSDYARYRRWQEARGSEGKTTNEKAVDR